MGTMLNLNTWTGVVPVLLPWGEPTISPIGVASAGVAVPFFIYIIAMFVIIVPVWMNNFESDKQQQKQLGGMSDGPHFSGISIEQEVVTDFPGMNDLNPYVVGLDYGGARY